LCNFPICETYFFDEGATMKNLALSLFLLVLACFPAVGNAAANEKIQTCIACHGADGRSGKDGVASLGGRNYKELVEAMKALRDAHLPQPLILHTMTDQEIQEVATYFSETK
jgi:cytochrome c553